MDPAEEGVSCLSGLALASYHNSIIISSYHDMDPTEGVSCLSGQYSSERDPHCSANNQQGLHHLKQYSSNFLQYSSYFLQYLGDKTNMFIRVFQNAQKSKDLRGRLAKYVVIHN